MRVLNGINGSITSASYFLNERSRSLNGVNFPTFFYRTQIIANKGMEIPLKWDLQKNVGVTMISNSIFPNKNILFHSGTYFGLKICLLVLCLLFCIKNPFHFSIFLKFQVKKSEKMTKGALRKGFYRIRTSSGNKTSEYLLDYTF